MTTLTLLSNVPNVTPQAPLPIDMSASATVRNVGPASVYYNDELPVTPGSSSLAAGATTTLTGTYYFVVFAGSDVQSTTLIVQTQTPGAAPIIPLDSPIFTGTPTGPTASQDTNTTQLATTAFVIGQASSLPPIMDGIVAVGTSLRYARGDHVHPTDTSRAPVANPAFTGVATATTRFQAPQMRTIAGFGSDALRNLAVITDTEPTVSIDGGGVLSFGLGGNTPIDLQLYRQAAATLRTNGSLLVDSAITANNLAAAALRVKIGAVGPSGEPALTFGGDVLYQPSAAVLKTTARFEALNLRTFASSGGVAYYNKLNFADANPAYQVSALGATTWGAGGASATDVSLYRTAAATLRTDGSLTIDGTLNLGTNASAAKVNSDLTGNLFVRQVTNTTLSLGRSGSLMQFFESGGAYKQTADGTLGNLVTILRSYGLVG